MRGNSPVTSGAAANPAAFASALCELAENPERIGSMGACAAEFANANYSLPTMLQSLDALYTALLEKQTAVSENAERR